MHKIKPGKVEVPMIAFCINGYSSQKIELVIKEVIGCTDADTYDVMCNVLIDAGCYHVKGIVVSPQQRYCIALEKN